MTKDEINSEYFEWMYDQVCDDRYTKRPSYRKLLQYLHNVEFTYIIPMDGNRAEDGINLRYKFGREYGYEDSVVAIYLDDKPCSVLEMMMSLARRCEHSIMDNADIGDRLGQWFWGMIVNLGLGKMHDDAFDKDYCEYVAARFLNREYEPNGEGGLFTVERTSRDLRDVDIWYQMCWYLNENAD